MMEEIEDGKCIWTKAYMVSINKYNIQCIPNDQIKIIDGVDLFDDDNGKIT